MNKYTIDAAVLDLPARLSRIGVKVPKALTEAKEMLGWKVPPVDLEPFERAVKEARTEQDFGVRVLELSQARSLALYAPTDHVTTRFRRELMADRYRSAVRDHAAELFDATISFYDDHARVFTDAVRRLPDLTVTRLVDLTPDEATDIHTARTEAYELNAGLAVYDGLCKGVGIPMPLVDRIGEFPDTQSRDNAMAFIKGDDRNAAVAAYAPFAPHVGVVLHGGTLRLADPAHAKALAN